MILELSGTSSTSAALIPYSPPLVPMEFVESEVERGLSNRSMSIEQAISNPPPFWDGRTSEINHSISRAFEAIAHDTESKWGLFNGSDTYSIGGIKEHKLMRKLILGAPAGCKNFYALDIGAGNYQWGRQLATYLNAKKDIPKDVTIHIIGIRGETNLDKAVTALVLFPENSFHSRCVKSPGFDDRKESPYSNIGPICDRSNRGDLTRASERNFREIALGQCKLYEFGQFQVETLMDEFQKRGLQLANKVDLVVSSWCFRHLVDPVGTFAQTYDLLRPKTGHLLLDGFFFLHEKEKALDKSLDFNGRMTRLCLETRAPFLTRRYNSTRSLDHFIVRKPDDHPCHLQKQYLGTESLGWGWQVGSETVTRFKELKKTDVEAPLLYEGDYRGDKDLYEWLRQKGLLHDSDLVWGPLQVKDANKKTPPLHIAIVSGDEEAVFLCLQEGCDINESDGTGSTPLHLAIKHNNYKLFSLLLEKGAQTKLFASGCTPLHLAMRYDLDGCFIKALIVAGADVNIKPDGFDELTPLDFAIMHKNVKAVELLLEVKVIVNYKNRRLLDSDSSFSSIQHLLPKRLSELDGFSTIIKHIQKGGCVILTYPNDFSARKFQKTTQLEEQGIPFRVTVNPETRLLDDWNYGEIEDLSQCEAKVVFGEDTSKEPQVELRFGY